MKLSWEEKNRPLDADSVYFIRLWYLGAYRGATATRKLTVRQIARVMRRSDASVREALQPYLCGEK